MNSIYKFLSRLRHFSIPSGVALILVALFWSSLAFCSETHNAALDCDSEKIKAQLKDNPSFPLNNKKAWTPLHAAAYNGYKDVAELLLTKGADVNAKTNTAWTPLHVAAYSGHKDVVELLLTKGADIYAKASNGWTPLRAAAKAGHKGMAELLRQYGGQE